MTGALSQSMQTLPGSWGVQCYLEDIKLLVELAC